MTFDGAYGDGALGGAKALGAYLAHSKWQVRGPKGGAPLSVAPNTSRDHLEQGLIAADAKTVTF